MPTWKRFIKIYEYIAYDLLAPENAMAQYKRIADAILSLDIFPDRFALFEMEPVSCLLYCRCRSCHSNGCLIWDIGCVCAAIRKDGNKQGTENRPLSPESGSCIMKYILKPDYALRGFDHGRQKVLTDLRDGSRYPLTDLMAFVLGMCDGETDFDRFTLFPAYRQIAERACRDGLVTEAAAGQKLRPEQTRQTVPVLNITGVQWSLTGRCNAACRHCYLTASQHGHRDPDTEEMLRILDILAENRVRRIAITGGEPLLRADLPLLLDRMVQNGQLVTGISTNGFLLTDRMADQFLSRGMCPDIQLSFDGPGHHDWMRGVPGAEEMAIAAMDVCARKGLSCALAMCLHRENIRLLVPTVRLAVDHGVSCVRACAVSDMGGFSSRDGMTLFRGDEIIPYYLEAIPEIVKDRPEITVEFAGVMRFRASEPEDYRILPLIRPCADPSGDRVCLSVENTCYISDEGRLLPCITVAGSPLEQDFPKLTENTFEKCMNSPAYRRFLSLRTEELVRRNPECAACEYLPLCGCGCRGNPVSRAGDLYGIDRERCLFFRHHWPEKIRQVMAVYPAKNTAKEKPSEYQ